MPRFRRQVAPGSVQHVISRFVNREHRFDVPGARREYLRRAGRVLEQSDWHALGYALMSSHVHWALLAGTQPSAAIIKPLHVGFAGWLNAAEGRLGPVFSERHRSVTVEGETAAALLAYIHNNPVRAGLVEDPAASSWTSHRAYGGFERAQGWLDVALGLHLSGFSPSPSGRLAFHEMVRSRARHSKAMAVDTFEVEVHPVTPLVLPMLGSVQVRWTGDPERVVAAVERSLDVDDQELRSHGRRRRVSQARRLALLVWTTGLHRPAIEMARVLGLSGSSAAGLTASATKEARQLAAELAKEIRG